jgi:membrane associated rhomboid family serine protease
VPCGLIAVIIVNCFVLVLTYLVYTPDTIFRQFGFIPAHHEWPTNFTSMFLHSGFWHILGNMWFLWMFGVWVENAFTKWLFLPA